MVALLMPDTSFGNGATERRRRAKGEMSIEESIQHISESTKQSHICQQGEILTHLFGIQHETVVQLLNSGMLDSRTQKPAWLRQYFEPNCLSERAYLYFATRQLLSCTSFSAS